MALYAEVHPPTPYQSSVPGVSLAFTSLTTPPSALAMAAVSSPGNGSSQSEASVGQKGSCSVFKILDECRDKIPPKRTRYGLFNSESKTMYHCHCTRRTFHTLTRQHQPLTPVQNVLLGLLSPSCFLLKDDTLDQISGSPAVLREAELSRLQSSADAEEQRHLMAVLQKCRRRGGGVKVHKVCLRMLRHKVHKAGSVNT